MHKIRRFWILPILVLILACVLGSVFAARAGEDENLPMDYVLVVDVSETMNDTAPDEVCAAACDLFIDLLPYRNVRVGVIAYGYDADSATAYKYSDETRTVIKQKVANRFEEEFVHLIAPVQEAATAMSRSNIMEKLSAAYKVRAMKSVHGQALVAAVDMLEQAGAVDGQAKIILLSDGQLANGEWVTANRYKEAAIDMAKEHEWPIYTIELDFENKHQSLGNVNLSKLDAVDEHGPGSRTYPRALMMELAYQTGATKQPIKADGSVDRDAKSELGTWVISSPNKNKNDLINKIHIAFMQILGGSLRRVQSVDGDVVVPCQIPNLTCEYVVGVTAVGLDSITVKGPGDSTGTIYRVSDSTNPARIIEKGSQHFTVRLFCPDPGEWTITAHAARDVESTVYTDLTTDVEVAFNGGFDYNGARTEMQEGASYDLDKRGQIGFDLGLSYHGVSMKLDPAANDVRAALEVYRLDGGSRSKLGELEMTAGRDGFHLDQTAIAKLIGEDATRGGSYSVRAWVENDRLGGDNRVRSGYIDFEARDLAAEILVPEMDALKAPVFSKVEIDLEKYLNNPDGDALHFKLVNTDPEGPEFFLTGEDGTPVTEITGNPASLELLTGAYVGTHELKLVIDDFAAQFELPLRVTVENGAPVDENERISIKLSYGTLSPWFDALITGVGKLPFLSGLEDSVRTRLTAGGSEAYELSLEDPEGQPLEFVVTDAGEPVDGKAVCLLETAGNTLAVKPNSEGKVTAEVLVYDGAYVKDANGQYVKAAFGVTLKVEVESISNNLVEMLITIGLILLVVLIITVLVLVAVKSNTAIRGTWKIEIRAQGNRIWTQDINMTDKKNLGDTVLSAGNILRSRGNKCSEGCVKLSGDDVRELEQLEKHWFKLKEKNHRGDARSRNVENMKFCGVFLLPRGNVMKIKKISTDNLCKVLHNRLPVRGKTVTMRAGDSVTFKLNDGTGDLTIILKSSNGGGRRG